MCFADEHDVLYVEINCKYRKVFGGHFVTLGRESMSASTDAELRGYVESLTVRGHAAERPFGLCNFNYRTERIKLHPAVG